MAASDRPSGLTTLAVVNFVFAGLDILGGISMFGSAVAAQFPEFAAEIQRDSGLTAAEYARMSMLLGLWCLAESVLLGVLGVGFLRQSRRWGFHFGNAYGVIGIAGTVLVLNLLPAAMRGGEHNALQSLVDLFYPAFVLILVNVVFRRDLAR